jgi:hypothetical protein
MQLEFVSGANDATMVRRNTTLHSLLSSGITIIVRPDIRNSPLLEKILCGKGGLGVNKFSCAFSSTLDLENILGLSL